MKNCKRKRSKGFTLAEMMTVVGIMGMISVIAVPQYVRSARNARESALRANLASVRTALQACMADTGVYPTSLATLANTTPAITTGFDITGAAATISATDWRGPYIRPIPTDPVSGASFNYAASTGTISASATGNDLAGVAFSTY